MDRCTTALSPNVMDWKAYIDRADGVVADADAIWRAIVAAPGTDPDYLREATFSLRRVLIVTYRAALVLLRDPDVAYPSEVLLRGLLEVWAQLAWIQYGEPRVNRRAKRYSRKRNNGHCMSDDRCAWSCIHTRALCWLYGDARGYHMNVRSADTRIKIESATRQARLRAVRYRHAHDITGCPGKYGRDYGDVEPMLSLLGRKFDLAWPTGLWRAYSATAHAAAPIRLGHVPDGSMIAGPLADYERRGMLTRGITILLNAWQMVLNLSDLRSLEGNKIFVAGVAPRAAALMAELNALDL